MEPNVKIQIEQIQKEKQKERLKQYADRIRKEVKSYDKL